MLRKIMFYVMTGLIILGQGNTAVAEEFIGGLRKVKGSAYIERKTQKIAAQNGAKILQNDILKTGPDGSMGVIFNDNTRISIGPESELIVLRYLFEPDQSRFSFLGKIIKGTLSYISGSLGKFAPDSVAVETPTTTIGIRGTRFLVKIENPE
ncbi:MAG: FecR family protein [Thermodesulfobacteriota bacterium]